jgi:aromatic-L-amino-acid decarboxylase
MVRSSRIRRRGIPQIHSTSQFIHYHRKNWISHFLFFQTISLNETFASLIQKSDTLSLVTQPSLALSVFRICPRREAENQTPISVELLNELNRLFYGRLSARTDIMLTQTTLNGIFCVRLAIGSARTTGKHIVEAYDILTKEAEATLEVWEQTINGTVIDG